jgi:hypothetical protein
MNGFVGLKQAICRVSAWALQEDQRTILTDLDKQRVEFICNESQPWHYGTKAPNHFTMRQGHR